MKSLESQALIKSFERLSAKGVMDANGSISLRLEKYQGFEIKTHQGLKRYTLDEPDLQGDALLHQHIYKARQDVGAMTLTHQRFASQLAQIGTPLVDSVFDEQLRCIGRAVVVMDEIDSLAKVQYQLTRGGHSNAFVLSKNSEKPLVICFGFTLELLTFNVELLEKCAKAYILASATGMKVKKIPWLIRLIATRRLAKDRKCAMAYIAKGQAVTIDKRY